MKKVILSLSVVAILATAVCAQQVNQKEKEQVYTLKFTANEIAVLGYVIDKSSAEHNYVTAVAKSINEQLSTQTQAADSTVTPAKETTKKK